MADSPATRDGGQIAWIAPFGAGAWTLTRTGEIERILDGRWDVRHPPVEATPPRDSGAIVAVSAERADAIHPFLWDGMLDRSLVRATTTTVTASVHINPLPHALAYAEDLGGTVVGSGQGRIYLFGARGLEELGQQTMGSLIQTVVPARHGQWTGVIYAGLNGYLRELYVGAEVCLPTGLWFNVVAMASAGTGWVAVGTTQPPSRQSTIAWITRAR
jgi:hypothetical protein